MSQRKRPGNHAKGIKGKPAKALEGTWRVEHLFALEQAYNLYQFHHLQMGECD